MARPWRPNRLPAAVVACALAALAPAAWPQLREPQEGTEETEEPTTGGQWKSRAASLRDAIRGALDEAMSIDAEVAAERKDVEFLRGVAPEWRANGWLAEAKEADEKADWKEGLIRGLEGFPRRRRAFALAARENLVKALDNAAEAYAREGRPEKAAACLALAAEAEEGLPSSLDLPRALELRPELMELFPPERAPRFTEDEARADLRGLLRGADPATRAARLEAAARRLRRAADLLEAAGRKHDAQRWRAEAAGKDAEAAGARQQAADGAPAPPAAPPSPASTGQVPRLDHGPIAADRIVRYDLGRDAVELGELLVPDLNFTYIEPPPKPFQKMVIDSLGEELQGTLTIAGARPLSPPGSSPTQFGTFFAAFPPHPGAPTPAAATATPGIRLFFASLGRSTGEAFEAHVVGAGPLPERIDFAGLVVEPLAKGARRAIEREVRKLAGGKRASARVDAYCLEFLRLPPETDMVFRIGGPEAQRAFAPVRRILAASRHLHEAGALSPDSDPAAYFHSIRQWAVWTWEQAFDEQGYSDAFVAHTRRNLEASGEKWSRGMEQALRQVTAGRWRDIGRILAEAGRAEGVSGLAAPGPGTPGLRRGGDPRPEARP